MIPLSSHSLNGFLSILLMITSACALGPVSHFETASTLGSGHHEVLGGYGMGGYIIKWNYGLTDQMDLGLQIETLSLGVRAKYALYQHEMSPWKAAIALGTGSGVANEHTYLDLMGSYQKGSWEPFSNLRLVTSKIDRSQVNTSSKGSGNAELFSDELFRQYYGNGYFNYFQYFVGTRYKMNSGWAWAIEGSTLVIKSKTGSTESIPLIGMSLSKTF